ncbi:MAG: HTH-type transcriptional regulator/antitoxin HigA [Oceanospirillaceae bacterium]|jgi:HTH-type transcriptional regulator/antitoxin HigA
MAMSNKMQPDKNLVEGLTPDNAHGDELTSLSLAEIVLKASASDHQIALKRIETLFDAALNTPKGDELERLIVFVEAYENEHYPI